jgi:hypothetical protein
MKQATKRLISLIESDLDPDCSLTAGIMKGYLINGGYEDSLLELKKYILDHQGENMYLSKQ